MILLQYGFAPIAGLFPGPVVYYFVLARIAYPSRSRWRLARHKEVCVMGFFEAAFLWPSRCVMITAIQMEI